MKCLNCKGKCRPRRIFCCITCCVEFNWKQKIKCALETGVTPKFPRRAKLLVLKIRGRKCEICGCTEWMGKPTPLVLDHINGNSLDRRLTNLRLVCGNCDMQLPTFKSKNRGKGRVGDRNYRRNRKG